jgi:hypothetical protein
MQGGSINPKPGGSITRNRAGRPALHGSQIAAAAMRHIAEIASTVDERADPLRSCWQVGCDRRTDRTRRATAEHKRSCCTAVRLLTTVNRVRQLNHRSEVSLRLIKVAVIASWSGRRNAIHGVRSQFLGLSVRQSGAVCQRNSNVERFNKASPGFEPTFFALRQCELSRTKSTAGFMVLR